MPIYVERVNFWVRVVADTVQKGKVSILEHKVHLGRPKVSIPVRVTVSSGVIISYLYAILLAARQAILVFHRNEKVRIENRIFKVT